MLKIERCTEHGDGSGFDVTMAEPGMGVRARKFHARNLVEVRHALTHYFGYGRHVRPVRRCPFCQDRIK